MTDLRDKSFVLHNSKKQGRKLRSGGVRGGILYLEQTTISRRILLTPGLEPGPVRTRF